jgi:hypothetical protein
VEAGFEPFHRCRNRAIALESLKVNLTANKAGIWRNRQKTPSEFDKKAGYFDQKGGIFG